MLVEDTEEFEVEAILDHRYKRKLGKQTLQYLVKWTGYDQSESAWEPEESLGNSPEILGEYRKRSGLPPLLVGRAVQLPLASCILVLIPFYTFRGYRGLSRGFRLLGGRFVILKSRGWCLPNNWG